MRLYLLVYVIVYIVALGGMRYIVGAHVCTTNIAPLVGQRVFKRGGVALRLNFFFLYALRRPFHVGTGIVGFSVFVYRCSS